MYTKNKSTEHLDSEPCNYKQQTELTYKQQTELTSQFCIERVEHVELLSTDQQPSPIQWCHARHWLTGGDGLKIF